MNMYRYTIYPKSQSMMAQVIEVDAHELIYKDGNALFTKYSDDIEVLVGLVPISAISAITGAELVEEEDVDA